jgi:hypothetical protein
MVQLIKIVKSEKQDKKYDAHFITDSNRLKIVSFGAKGYSDYTIHKDPERKERYWSRHRGDNLDDPMSPGALSWFVLWTSTTLRGGIKNYKSYYNL